jgi:20S proteasome subunit alpha 7
MQRYHGAAVGKGRQGAKNEIEKLKLSELTCREAVVEVAKILHRVHDEEKGFEMELAWVCEESGREFGRVPDALAAEAEAAAKAALEAEDMDD